MLRKGDILEVVDRILELTGLDPQLLELELTEGAIMTDAEANIVKLKELKAIGLDLAVDDFGTGYSSLSYLKRFPIDTLKIDQSFIADLGSPDGAAIIDAILALSRTLNLRVIAEGIETAEQMRYLVDKKCDLLQGYYFSVPVYPEEVPNLLRHNFSEQLASGQ